MSTTNDHELFICTGVIENRVHWFVQFNGRVIHTYRKQAGRRLAYQTDRLDMVPASLHLRNEAQDVWNELSMVLGPDFLAELESEELKFLVGLAKRGGGESQVWVDKFLQMAKLHERRQVVPSAGALELRNTLETGQLE